MNTKQLFFTFLLLSIVMNLNAQFKIDAQYRLRGQALHGYKTPVSKDVDAAFHVGQRTRLNLRYNSENYSSLLSFQDVRTWGDANIVNATGVQGKGYNTIDIYEAWVNFKFNQNSHLKIGRQELKYDDQRHISWRNWWDRGQTYDALTYTYDNKSTGWRLDLSGSYNSKFQNLQGNNYSDGTDYFGNVNPIQTQVFAYVKKKVNSKLQVSLLLITAGYQNEDNPQTLYMTNTEGLHINFNTIKKSTDGLFAVANAFVQNGNAISGKKISSNLLTAQLGYRGFSRTLQVAVKMERLSGHDATKFDDAEYNKVDHTYNLLTGGRHPYYEGYMDWFVVPKSTKNAGLMNVGASIKYKLTSKDIIGLDYSNVSSVTPIFKEMDGTDRLYYDKGLAGIFDFAYIRKVAKDIKWMNGFSYGMPTDGYNQIKGITDPGTNFYFYTMITFKPSLFDSSNK